MTVFDTETMAELCVKQGLVDQAIAIYHRLVAESGDATARQRYQERIVAIGERTVPPPPLETPGLRVEVRDGEVEVEWRLPIDTMAPTLQLLLLRLTPGGIETDGRTLALASAAGRTKVAVADLHSVRAAAGRLEGEAFVPMVRLSPMSRGDR